MVKEKVGECENKMGIKFQGWTKVWARVINGMRKGNLTSSASGKCELSAQWVQIGLGHEYSVFGAEKNEQNFEKSFLKVQNIILKFTERFIPKIKFQGRKNLLKFSSQLSSVPFPTTFCAQNLQRTNSQLL